jgi:hypothetical protein
MHVLTQVTAGGDSAPGADQSPGDDPLDDCSDLMSLLGSVSDATEDSDDWEVP